MTQAFNLSQLANFVNTSGQLNAATGLFNQVPVANGGTGLSTVTSGALLLGAGTSAMTVLSGTTPGTVVASSPAGWSAQPQASVAGGDYILQPYVSPNVWTKPATIKAIKVTVIGGGGNGGASGSATPTAAAGAGGGGGGGGSSIRYLDAPALPASPITITAGPGTNSFGAFASATGGANGTNGGIPNAAGSGGAGGTGSSGTFNFNGSPGGAATAPTGGGSGSSAIFTGIRLIGSGPGANPGSPNTVFGGGGTGGGGRSQPLPGSNPGGTGGTGTVIVEEFY